MTEEKRYRSLENEKELKQKIDYEQVKRLIPNETKNVFDKLSPQQRRKIATFVLENERLGSKKKEYKIDCQKVRDNYNIVFLIKNDMGNYVRWTYDEVMSYLFYHNHGRIYGK